MRQLLLAASALFLSGVFARPADLSAQSPVTGSAEINFLSHYLFAGIPFAAGEVTQARVTVGSGGFTFNGFSVYDYEASDLTEADLYGDYYAQIAPTLGLFVGAALYNFQFPSGWEATPELYAGLVLTAPLNPTLYVAHDFDLGDGTQALLMLSHSVPLGTGGATLDFAGNLGYNDGYYTDISGFSYADLGASVGLPVGPLTISPLVLVQFGIHETFVDEEVFGVRASIAF